MIRRRIYNNDAPKYVKCVAARTVYAFTAYLLRIMMEYMAEL